MLKGLWAFRCVLDKTESSIIALGIARGYTGPTLHVAHAVVDLGFVTQLLKDADSSVWVSTFMTLKE